MFEKGDFPMSRKKIFLSLSAIIFLGILFVNEAFASEFLTLPLTEDFRATCVFGNTCYKNHLGNDYATTTVGHEVVAGYDGTVIKAIDDNIANMMDCVDSCG